VGEENLWDDFDSGQHKLEIEDPEHFRAEQIQDFERRVEAFNLWAGIEEPLQDVADGTYWDEQDEEAAALSEILEATGELL
jgi:hypothetical protein